MLGIKVEITSFVEGGYPGWVECKLVDADGDTHLFHDKVPVVLQDLDENSKYPTVGVIACELTRRFGDSIIYVSTEFPWHIESSEGRTEFKLDLDQVREFGPADSAK